MAAGDPVVTGQQGGGRSGPVLFDLDALTVTEFPLPDGVANARANTISAVASNAGKQVGIMVVRVP